MNPASQIKLFVRQMEKGTNWKNFKMQSYYEVLKKYNWIR